jgi:hypothetical protein
MVVIDAVRTERFVKSLLKKPTLQLIGRGNRLCVCISQENTCACASVFAFNYCAASLAVEILCPDLMNAGRLHSESIWRPT